MSDIVDNTGELRLRYDDIAAGGGTCRSDAYSVYIDLALVAAGLAMIVPDPTGKTEARTVLTQRWEASPSDDPDRAAHRMYDAVVKLLGSWDVVGGATLADLDDAAAKYARAVARRAKQDPK